MPEISVIVPVYKVEDYLPTCVQSILCQTFLDFELILVDDGSPDRCGIMCDEFAAMDNRIRVVHQKNKGLSGARNAGMEIAQGEYITFVDSDDIVAPFFLEELYRAIRETAADMAVCLSCDLNEVEILNYASYAAIRQKAPTLLDKRTSIVGLYNGTCGSSIGSTCKLYKSAYILELRFPEGRLHEDQFFTPKAFWKAEKIVYIDSGIYFYRVREASITHKSFSAKRYDDLWAIDSCIAFFREKGETEIVEAALRRRQRLLCTYALYAHGAGVEVPEQYKIGLLKALRYLRRNVSADKYQYCLAQIHPKLAVLDAYIRKLESMLHGKK